MFLSRTKIIIYNNAYYKHGNTTQKSNSDRYCLISTYLPFANVICFHFKVLKVYFHTKKHLSVIIL